MCLLFSIVLMNVVVILCQSIARGCYIVFLLCYRCYYIVLNIMLWDVMFHHSKGLLNCIILLLGVVINVTMEGGRVAAEP